jgi:hypothetical protein
MAPRFLADESAEIVPGEKAFRLLVGQYAPLSGKLDKNTRNEPQTESIIVLKHLASEVNPANSIRLGFALLGRAG